MDFTALLDKKKRANATLTPCQRRADAAVRAGRNVLITGPGGTGKSFLLDTLRRDRALQIDVTATTGIAALNVGGVTVHSWAGLGLGEDPLGDVLMNIRSRPRVLRRIHDAVTLAVDEISMAGAELLDLLDAVLKDIRGDERPFGGVQMVFFGDFLQLPPVRRDGKPARFAFEADSWRGADVETVELRTVVRQADADFAGLLHRIRRAEPTEADLELLRARHAAPRPLEGPAPVRLFNTNRDVDAYNWEKLVALEHGGDGYEYHAIDAGEGFQLATLDKNCIAPKRLTLRVGAQVMLLKNLSFEDGLVNGSVGLVEEFDESGVPLVSFPNGLKWRAEKHRWEMKQGYSVVASREQYPLRLAWGITVHKSQGMTLDMLEADAGACFERGQAYVALSRAKRLDGLWLSAFRPEAIMAHPKALEFYRGNTTS